MVFTPTDWGQSRGRSAVNCWLDAADGQPISRQCCSWEESEAKCEHLKHHRVSNRFKPNWKADLFFLFYFFLFYLLNIETFVSSDRTGSVLRGTCCHAFNAFLWFFHDFSWFQYRRLTSSFCGWTPAGAWWHFIFEIKSRLGFWVNTCLECISAYYPEFKIKSRHASKGMSRIIAHLMLSFFFS